MGFNNKTGWIRVTNENHKIVIVGAGMAGLTAAAYLSKAGLDVLLIEKTDSAGGLLTSFEKDGFFFDFGARSIENSGAVRPLLNELDISLNLLPSPVSVGIEDEIIHFTSEKSLEDYGDFIKKTLPRKCG